MRWATHRRPDGRVVAATMITLAPFAIFYGTEARAYGALACFSALSTLCLLRALERGAAAVGRLRPRRRSPSPTRTTWASSCLLVQAAWAFWVHRDRLRGLVVVHGLIVLACLPWIPSFVLAAAHSGDEATRVARLVPPTLDRFLALDVKLVLGHPFFTLREIPGRVAVAIADHRGRRRAGRRGPARLGGPPRPVVRAAGAHRAARRRHADRGGPDQRPAAHAALLLPRNYSASLSAAALIVAWLLTTMPGPRAAPVAVAAVLGVLVAGAVQASGSRWHRRSDYRDAAAWVEARARPGDPVIQSFVFRAARCRAP